MTATARTPDVETPEQTKKRLRKVAAATIFGSMLEWYDFYLYATMAAIVFSKIFFDNSDPKAATLMAFSTFAIGFIARPFGGILFGYLGDKFGRKQVLVLTFCMMGVCTTLIGLIPSYASIGIWAPIVLVFIRIIQGLGAGAELSGAAVTSYEHASEGKRGSRRLADSVHLQHRAGGCGPVGAQQHPGNPGIQGTEQGNREGQGLAAQGAIQE
jgi:MFS family permease